MLSHCICYWDRTLCIVMKMIILDYLCNVILSYVMYSYIYMYVCMSSEVTGLILDVCVSVCCYFGACGLSLCLSVRGRSPVPAVLIISGCCSWLSSAGTEVWSSAPHTQRERERTVQVTGMNTQKTFHLSWHNDQIVTFYII